MSKIYGAVQQQHVSRVADSAPNDARITRDGAMLHIPWIQALCLEGRVMAAAGGSASLVYTSPGPFGTGAVDDDEFDYLHTIPATVAVIPVYYSVIIETVNTVDMVTNLLVWGNTGVDGGTSFVLTPFNMRPAAGIDSLCSIAACCDTGGTAINMLGCVFMSGASMMDDAVTTKVNALPAFSATTCSFVPVLEGSATVTQMAGFHSGQTPVGYIHSVWIELPRHMIS